MSDWVVFAATAWPLWTIEIDFTRTALNLNLNFNFNFDFNFIRLVVCSHREQSRLTSQEQRWIDILNGILNYILNYILYDMLNDILNQISVHPGWVFVSCCWELGPTTIHRKDSDNIWDNIWSQSCIFENWSKIKIEDSSYWDNNWTNVLCFTQCVTETWPKLCRWDNIEIRFAKPPNTWLFNEEGPTGSSGQNPSKSWMENFTDLNFGLSRMELVSNVTASHKWLNTYRFTLIGCKTSHVFSTFDIFPGINIWLFDL